MVASRGTYSKGELKRQEILESALQVVAKEGFRGTSVRHIAESVGLSQAGLLHYFDSKEDLFVAVLRARDERNMTKYGGEKALEPDQIVDRLSTAVRDSTKVPGLVELLLQMSVDAADPTHPAHSYTLTRNARASSMLSVAFTHMQVAGTATERVDAVMLALLLQSIGYGLQLLWLQDRDLDMVATLSAFFTLLSPEGSGVDDGAVSASVNGARSHTG